MPVKHRLQLYIHFAALKNILQTVQKGHLRRIGLFVFYARSSQRGLKNDF